MSSYSCSTGPSGVDSGSPRDLRLFFLRLFAPSGENEVKSVSI